MSVAAALVYVAASLAVGVELARAAGATFAHATHDVERAVASAALVAAVLVFAVDFVAYAWPRLFARSNDSQHPTLACSTTCVTLHALPSTTWTAYVLVAYALASREHFAQLAGVNVALSALWLVRRIGDCVERRRRRQRVLRRLDGDRIVSAVPLDDDFDTDDDLNNDHHDHKNDHKDDKKRSARRTHQ